MTFSYSKLYKCNLKGKLLSQFHQAIFDGEDGESYSGFDGKLSEEEFLLGDLHQFVGYEI